MEIELPLIFIDGNQILINFYRLESHSHRFLSIGIEFSLIFINWNRIHIRQFRLIWEIFLHFSKFQYKLFGFPAMLSMGIELPSIWLIGIRLWSMGIRLPSIKIDGNSILIDNIAENLILISLKTQIILNHFFFLQ